MCNLGSKEGRAGIAIDTLEILKSGAYTNKLGKSVNIKEHMEFAINNSVLYGPEGIQEIGKLNKVPIIEITDESTISAARRIVMDERFTESVCLNFASAKNPGGGFIKGSQAQEESLARSSGLYPCIAQMKKMYNYNSSLKTCLYSDYMIYSPKVPVFRNDSNILMDQPFLVSFITAPAVNAGVLIERQEENQEKIDTVMIQRIRKIIILAVKNGNNAIILGAYGCGVFRNKPENVAGYFKKILIDEGYCKCFDKIAFAIYDKSQNKENLNVFRRALIC